MNTRKEQIHSAIDCTHDYAHGIALVPHRLKIHMRGREGLVTHSFNDYEYRLASCMKCVMCGDSKGFNYD